MASEPASLKESANKIEKLIRQGIYKDRIKSRVRSGDFEEAFSIARALISNSRTGKLPDSFAFNESDLRFATNQVIAAYRAKRLACDEIVDVGCGIGMQAIAFAKTCKRVIAVDIDPRKVGYAKFNAEKEGVGNIEFHSGDGMALLKTIKKADVIFCDPERPATEASRSLGSLQPAIQDLIGYYGKISESLCIELPPQIRWVAQDSEREYISLNGQLNRLNIYLGKARLSNISAVCLPQEARLTDKDEENIFAYASPLDYIYEVDPAAERAGLVQRIPGQGLFMYEKYLTSEKLVKGDFFKASYKVLAIESNGKDAIRHSLAGFNARKAVLHGNIAPDRYWEEKNAIQAGLAGEKTLHVFLGEDEAIICEKG
ncbi:methyltransferase domain-containing protein [Candidatus Woesearchaeota archaeon]|nr:methyltransferase domain-containing protein [Candidatus Woesearchaeota archaeon]